MLSKDELIKNFVNSAKQLDTNDLMMSIAFAKGMQLREELYKKERADTA